MTLMIDLNVQSAKLLTYNNFTAEKKVPRGNAEVLSLLKLSDLSGFAVRKSF
jgi:hypothetical protein